MFIICCLEEGKPARPGSPGRLRDQEALAGPAAAKPRRTIPPPDLAEILAFSMIL